MLPALWVDGQLAVATATTSESRRAANGLLAEVYHLAQLFLCYQNARRCTVAGVRRSDGMLMSVVCEDVGATVVLYPHGIESQGVALDAAQQRVLARWLLEREATPHRCRP